MRDEVVDASGRKPYSKPTIEKRQRLADVTEQITIASTTGARRLIT
jgi:hypothetical protein